MRITISGTPGSGKSTAAKLLEEQLGYPRIYAGQIFRDAAAARGMTLEDFGAYVGDHPGIDQELDDRLVAAAREHEDLILEGRLAGWMMHRHHVPALRVWITASEDTRIARLMQRDGGTIEETRAKLRRRASDERNRYRAHYGLDLDDLSIYDVVMETDALPPEQVVERIRSGMASSRGM